MNLDTSAMAAQPLAFPHNMSNVIDSLKRLERIGSEESQTVQKILDAAKELSQTISKHFPESLRTRPIIAHVDDEGNILPGEWTYKSPRRVVKDGKARTEIRSARHTFAVYSVENGYEPRLTLFRDSENVFVGHDRDTALIFSKDIANGLLEAINQFIEAEHKASEEGLTIVAAAAEGLRSLSKTSDEGDSAMSF